MKTLKYLAVALVALLGIGAQFASAQSYYPGSLATMTPNYVYPAATFTAASQNGTAIGLGGLGSGIIEVKATTITTATWAIEGSVDGGTTWFELPTTALSVVASTTPTPALTQTTTATATAYAVNLVGITQVRFITTSGTFTATGFSLTLAANSNKGLL